MKLESWIRANKNFIDWKYFASQWDAMQQRHNPFRKDQIETIAALAGILGVESKTILDLGCGPGTLGKRILEHRPDTRYYGMDADPLVLNAAQRLLPNTCHYQIMDIRTKGWASRYTNTFDCVVSLTALHWLSKVHLKEAFVAIYTALKPNGWIIVGDPFLPENEHEKRMLAAFQEERMALEKGPTWEEYWEELFRMYPIREIYQKYYCDSACDKLYEGSDDGYPVSFYLDSLGESGFKEASVFWKVGLRVVYGGMKVA
jgi:trans-aconitate methyltransferase